MSQLKLEDLHGIVLICHDPKTCWPAVECADHVAVPVEPTGDLWQGGVVTIVKSRFLPAGSHVQIDPNEIEHRFKRGEAKTMFVSRDSRQTIVVSVPTPEVAAQQKRFGLVISAVNSLVSGKEPI